MFQKRWDVLVVDDEPDILISTTLALKNTRVYGLPLNLIKCRGKAEAIEYLEAHSGQFGVSVAIIDVIMETPEAGLELCGYIRDDMRNRLTQIVIRTGQAGLAPEKSVVDRYDINAYLTKADATEDKLYCTVKSCIRQYLWSRTAMFNLWHTHDLVSASTSEDALLAALDHPRRFHMDPTGRLVSSLEESWAYFFDDRLVLGSGEYAAEAKVRAERDRLALRPALPLGEALESLVDDEQDSYVLDSGVLLVKLAASKDEGLPRLDFVARCEFEMPRFMIDMLHARFKSTRILWRLLAERNKAALPGSR
jgi:CheY-like chemotaxis protein